jgi:hypothetical protein
MSFLQINSASPEQKRPFRLSDIQNIWDGIKSLFKAISGQDFRIISGFDLVNGVYTSGTVWYNGELYEYNRGTNPITPSTASVQFARIAQDNRTLQNGTIQPFSYKYVCGSNISAGESFTDFAANIEKYKTFLGTASVTAKYLASGSVITAKLADGAVTTAKIASEAVTREKLTPNLAPIVAEGSRLAVASNTTFSLSDLISEGSIQSIYATESATVTIDVVMTSGAFNSRPPIIHIPVFAAQGKTLTVKLVMGSTTIKTYTIPSDTVGVIILGLGNIGIPGAWASYVPVLA